MKQVLQDLKNGRVELADIQPPQLEEGHLLIRSVKSIVSSGTERMLVEFANANWLSKMRRQPDKVRMVLDKIRTDGILPTFFAVRSKLDRPMPLGYCNVGIVEAVGEGVAGFAVGDRVVSNGPHAQIVRVPQHLCAKVPECVSDESAAFTVLGAVALQGIRLASVRPGEAFAVIGLGLIGQMTSQILKARGCRVLGVDPDVKKTRLAQKFGIETVVLGQDPMTAAVNFSNGSGVDGVIITASTDSSEPIHQAALMSRRNGRIILIGVVGLEISRDDFYEKELSFQVSCSYGPNRYTPTNKKDSQDRSDGSWTVRDNFKSVLEMISGGGLEVEPLISHRFPLDQAGSVYRLLQSREPVLGILFDYTGDTKVLPKQDRPAEPAISVNFKPLTSMPVVGVIGAGNYAAQTLIPALKKAGAVLKTVVSSGGVSGAYAGRKFGFQKVTTDISEVFSDPQINTVIIATRHDSHAALVCRALRSGKHVFVEKPLAIRREELHEIKALYSSLSHSAPMLMIGYNRRFSPYTLKMKALLGTTSAPKALIMTVNAGAVPLKHWTQDPSVGGGRIIGECCHFVDLLRFLAGSPVDSVETTVLKSPSAAKAPKDSLSINLVFKDGSIGTIHYLANGHRSLCKERLEIFCEGRVLQLDNFRKLRGFGWNHFTQMRSWRQDKGHSACMKAFLNAIRQGAAAPIAFEEEAEVSKVCFDASEKAQGDPAS